MPQLGKQNYQTYSEDFTNAIYGKTNITVTAGQLDPFGGTNASKLEATASVATAMYCIPSSSGLSTGYSNGYITYSCYVKQGSGATDANKFIVYGPSVSTILSAAFDYSTGIITNISGTWTSNVEKLLGGWYRLSFTLAASLYAGTVYFYAFFNGSVETAGEYAYLYGMQAVRGNWAGSYCKTVATAADDLTIRNKVVQLHNLGLQSEDLTSASYTKNACTISSNVIANPVNGATTADGIIATAVNTSHFVRQTVTMTAGKTYTVSCYVKAGNQNFIAITDIGTYAVYFNLSAGTVGTISAGTFGTIKALIGGWYRCSYTFTASATSTGYEIYSSPSDGTTVFTGDAATVNTYVFGTQVVQANWAGAYTSTTTTAVNTGAIRNKVVQQQNLLTYSEDYSNVAWTKNAVTISGGAIANPVNEQLTATGLIPTVAGGAHYITESVSLSQGKAYTFSCYAKAGTLNFIILADVSGVLASWYNLSNGTTGTYVANTISKIEAYPNGWYRVSATFVAGASSTAIEIYPAPTDGGVVFTGDGVNISTYIYGVQCVQSNWAGEYNSTTASSYNVGVLRNKNIFQQNLLAYSEDFSNAAWTKDNMTVTTDADTAPDGTTTADRLYETVTNAVHRAYQGASSLANQTGHFCNYSIYAKGGGGRDWTYIGMNGGVQAFFNLTTGVVGSVTQGYNAGIDYMGNGWYRIWVSGLVTTSGNMTCGTSTDGAITTFAGDISKYITVWGAQIAQTNALIAYTKTVANSINIGTPRYAIVPSQNLIMYSNDPSQAVYSKTNITRTTGQVDPTGGTNAIKIEATASAATTLRYFGGFTVAGQPSAITLSAYFKVGTSATIGNNIVLRNDTTATNLVDAAWNYTTYAITYSSATGFVRIVPLFNGWIRVLVTVKTGFTAGNALSFYLGFSGGAQTAGDYFYFYGLQVSHGEQAPIYRETTSSAYLLGGISATPILAPRNTSYQFLNAYS